MYAGSTLRSLRIVDTWVGAHQKIDRVARKNLSNLLPDVTFPTAKQILKFEGINGPDGLKRKAAGAEEPRHFYDPSNPEDTAILDMIDDHYQELVRSLKQRDQTRASFEAAWLAHAIVDGLTPAHHYPYEEELTRLRGDEGPESRRNIKEKLVIPGDTLPKMAANNWRMWGDRGLLATHLAFEWGVAVVALPLRFRKSTPSSQYLSKVADRGITDMFQQVAAEIAELKLYERYYKTSWTPALGKVVRRELLPRIISLVTAVWYQAAGEARTA